MTKSGTRSASEMEKSFAALLKRTLEKQGLSQKQAAFAIWDEDEKSSQLSRYMNAKGGNPGAPTRTKISKGLGIPLEEIEACFGENPLSAKPVYTILQHEQRLEKQEARLRFDLERAHGAEKELLLSRLAVLEERIRNLNYDYNESKNDILNYRKNLEEKSLSIDSNKISAAHKALDDGETTLAAALFLDINLVKYGLIHTETAKSLSNYGVSCQSVGRLPEAEIFVNRAMTINLALERIDQRELINNINSLGLILQEQGKLEKALSFHQRALTICEEIFGEEDEDFPSLLNNIGLALKRQGKLSEAEEHYRRSLTLSERISENKNPIIGHRMNNLAGVLIEKGEFEDASALMEKALEVTEQYSDSKNIELIVLLANLATVHCRIKQFDRAEPYFLRALHLCEIHQIAASSRARNTLLNYGCMLRDMDRKTESEHMLKRVIQIDQSVGSIKSSEHAVALNHYAKMLATQLRQLHGEFLSFPQCDFNGNNGLRVPR